MAGKYNKKYNVCINYYIIKTLWCHCRGCNVEALFAFLGIENGDSYRKNFKRIESFKIDEKKSAISDSISDAMFSHTHFICRDLLEKTILCDETDIVFFKEYAALNIKLNERKKWLIERKGIKSVINQMYKQLKDMPENTPQQKFEKDTVRDELGEWEKKDVNLPSEQELEKQIQEFEDTIEKAQKVLERCLKRDFDSMSVYKYPEGNYEKLLYYIRHGELPDGTGYASFIYGTIESLDGGALHKALMDIEKQRGKPLEQKQLKKLLWIIQEQEAVVSAKIALLDSEKRKKRREKATVEV